MTLRSALDRTLLLMRDEILEEASDGLLVSALRETSVALVANEENLTTHSAQSAFVTAATLMARSAHNVFVLAPNIRMEGPQPPLADGLIVDQLLELGDDLIPGVSYSAKSPEREVDLAVALGDSPLSVRARRLLRLNASSWAGSIYTQQSCPRWAAGDWPIGGLTAGALAATETFKVSLRKLGRYARNPELLAGMIAPCADVSFEVAPLNTRTPTEIGDVDFVSGGAITNAALYALLRIPRLRGQGRIIEPQTSDVTNLNRYALLRRSNVPGPKARDLARVCAGTLDLEPIAESYSPDLLESLGRLSRSVLVGVDDIPARWAVQEANPAWLGIGATSHWSAMASFHRAGLGCARCLHNSDDPGTRTIPTVAFVSFWAGLLVAAHFLAHIAGDAVPANEQQIYLTPLRPEHPVCSPVPIRPNCRTCQSRKYTESAYA